MAFELVLSGLAGSDKIPFIKPGFGNNSQGQQALIQTGVLRICGKVLDSAQ